MLSASLNTSTTTDSFGATELHPYVNALNPQVDGLVCVYPNAGLPNELGAYDEPPDWYAPVRHRL